MITLKYNWGQFSSGKSDEIFSSWKIIFPDEVFPDKIPCAILLPDVVPEIVAKRCSANFTFPPCRTATLLRGDSGTSSFLWVLQKFWSGLYVVPGIRNMQANGLSRTCFYDEFFFYIQALHSNPIAISNRMFVVHDSIYF